MKDKYKDTYQSFQVNDDLIEQTKIQMQESINQRERKRVFNYKKLCMISMMMLVVIGIAVYSLLPSNTDFTAETVIKNVSYQGSSIYFEELGSDKTWQTSSLSWRDSDENTVLSLLDNYQIIKPKGYNLINTKAYVFIQELKKVDELSNNDLKIIKTYEMGNKTIMLVITNQIGELSKEPSTLNGINMDITYKQIKNTFEFHAAFQIDDNWYEVTTKNITQEEFLEYIGKFKQ